MKYLNTFLILLLFAATAQATTYTLGSGKWNDPCLWADNYPGTTIQANDIVIIKGQVTLTTSLLIQGTLQIEKGASLVGMKDVAIAKTGRLENDGNLVVGDIINTGTFINEMLAEAMTNVLNRNALVNNSMLLSGQQIHSEGIFLAEVLTAGC